MGKKSFEEFQESQIQLQEFMENTSGFIGNAVVTVRMDRDIVYSDNCETYERIETNDSQVTIAWSEDKGDKYFSYYSVYTNNYQDFICYGNILVIRGEDRDGNEIEIEIRKG